MIPKTGKPPGRKLVKRLSSRTKWLILAPLGLFLFSAGLWVFSEAAELKHNNEVFSRWFIMGIYSLILINAGLIIFGQSIVFHSQMLYRQEMRRELKRIQKELTSKLKNKKDKDHPDTKKE